MVIAGIGTLDADPVYLLMILIQKNAKTDLCHVTTAAALTPPSAVAALEKGAHHAGRLVARICLHEGVDAGGDRLADG